jgi:hypothetical protein
MPAQLTKDDFQKIQAILDRYPIQSAGVFGSFAKNLAQENSDLDILIKLKEDLSLLELIRLENQISEAISRKVDLVTEESLDSLLKEEVLGSTKMFYE